MRIIFFLLAALSIQLTACAGPEMAWRTAVDRGHPMVGRIVDPASGAELSMAQAATRLRGARFVLLGEKHDNPDHHVIQARLLAALADSGRRPAVAWEMIDADQAGRLAAFMRAAPTNGALMGEALGWSDTGWPEWSHYQPIADTAIAARLPMAAANLPRSALRRASSRFPSALPGAQLDSLRAELAASHCGQLPPAALAPMAQAQQRRDLAMADSLIAHATNDGAVLIAGNGHVRRDRGAPWWLARLGVEPASILSVGVLEVEPEIRTPDGFKSYAGQFDLIYLTPRVDSEDACVKFADQLKRLRK